MAATSVSIDTPLPKRQRTKPAPSLEAEAAVLAPILAACKAEHDAGTLTDHDFVGVFLLCYMAIRRPGAWAGGPLATPFAAHGSSRTLSSIPGLMVLLGEEYLERKLKQPANSIPVMAPFAHLQFVGIRKSSKRAHAANFLNAAMVGWSLGQRPFRLMHSVPTPSQVLRQQAEGSRVVTLLWRPTELASRHEALLAYMGDGQRPHAMDAFEFLVHDIKHMENFLDPELHLEQVGFFRALARLGGVATDGRVRLRRFFCEEWGLDQRLWDEMEYVISDMNCAVCHLLQYTLAKIIRAIERQNPQLGTSEIRDRVASMWDAMLAPAGMTGAVAEAARGMVGTAFRERGPMADEEAAALRSFFQNAGAGPFLLSTTDASNRPLAGVPTPTPV